MYYKSFLFFSILCLTQTNINANILQQNDDNQNLIYKGNGSLTIPLETGLYMYSYVFSAVEKSSIFGFTITSTPLNNSLEDESVKVIINFQNKVDRSYVTAATLILTPRNETKNYYFSKKSDARVTFMPYGTWSENEVQLTYHEIAFDTISKSSSANGTTLTPWHQVEGRSYRPNCVYVYYITKAKNMNISNIIVILNDLDIDEDVGEYLLIGAGSTPFKGPPPLFIANFIEAKQYLINDENAYVVLVSGSTRRNHRGFNITWHYTGTKFTKEKKKENEDVLESVPICIYNTTAAMKEFKKNSDLRFQDFRIKLARIASEYAKSKKENSLIPGNESISPSSVSIFRVSGVIYVNDTSEAFYVMVKISKETNDGKAAFKWHELEIIVDRYTECYSDTEEDIFKIGKCPNRKVPERWGNTFTLYLIIPVILCLLLLLFTWRLNPVTEYFEKKKRIHRASQLLTHKKFYEVDGSPNPMSTENPYTTLPKVQITTTQGRRYTVNLSDSLLNCVDQSEDEIFNRMHTERRDNIFDSRSVRSSSPTFSSKHPEINQAFTLDDEYSSQACFNDLTADRQEERSEHMYESVSSAAKLCVEDKEVTETKL